MTKIISPSTHEIYDQEIAELCALGLMSEEQRYNAQQEIDEGLQLYYESINEEEHNES